MTFPKAIVGPARHNGREMKQILDVAGTHITAEQIAAAPSDVRDWLRGLVGEAPHAADSFILERGGALSSENGLAICSGLEIKALLRRLADDYLACQALFALGCELYDAATGEHRDFVLDFHDFYDRTDIRDTFALDECLGRINEALRDIRRDPHATIHRQEHEQYRVHAVTQQRIYRFWRHLVKLPSLRFHNDASAAVRNSPGE
jgi:hypothetical protein